VLHGPDPLLGTTVGSYKIDRQIGSGGMGQVYAARQPEIGAQVAIKVLAPDAAIDPDLVDRFFAEARAVNIIRHERIVNVLDLGRLADGRPYIVMEHLPGWPLSQVLSALGPLPLGSLARLVGEALEGLAAAHQHGVVHRDLKPDNLFVTPSGHAKLLDFGIAKLAPDFDGRAATTRSSMLLGSPPYVSPEHAAGHPTDARADLYAIGILLYEGATGRRPFYGTGLFELLRQHVEVPPRPPREMRPDMPVEYESVILTALAKRPDDRFQSATAMAGALAHAAAGLPPPAFAPITLPGTTTATTPQPPPGTAATVMDRPTPRVVHPGYQPPPPYPVAAPPRRGRLALILVALAVLAAAGGAAIWAASQSEEEEPVAVAAVPVDAGVVVPPDGAPKVAAIPDAAPPDAAPVKKPVGVKPPRDDKPMGSSMKTPNPTRFDVSKFLPTARKLARGQAPDAELTLIRAEGVRLDGTVKLERDHQVQYHFWSPARVQDPDKWCMILVVVSPTSATANVARSSEGCSGNTKVYPRCSIAKVMKLAGDKGAPTDGTFTAQFLGSWGIRHGSVDWGARIDDPCD
jgi:hypothetical protein